MQREGKRSLDDGYNLRAKKARLEEHYVSPYTNKRTYRKKNPLNNLPNELIQKVFTYITYEELANSIRLVNRKFRVLAHHLINTAFRNIEKRLVHQKKLILNSISHSQDDMETRCMCKMLNTIEYLMLHYSILQSAIWRYVERDETVFCMYAGSILDLYEKIFRMYIREPHKVYTPAILNDYTYPKEVTKISQLTKTFVLYFDRVSEQDLNTSVFCSGCKILDILDCATEARKDVIEETIANDVLIYKVCYYFSRSWLVALETNDEKAKPWNEQMRLMYMRLRRIVVTGKWATCFIITEP
ncbi:PREDICTED: uncharacterized protein LOC108568464 [Nicrophorus vespilloides]|uniref:Uncharacterized protein LOC108568464 n=1 Tax=Nicrophorus vespilloides TaxID=110193 RepID=A0ABM1NE16_NICVS|nr:PREDICTED: uncharacterized protein LOC108568464 [Nicrophorus vespilloides]